MKNCKNQDPAELQVRDKINLLNRSGKNSFVEYSGLDLQRSFVCGPCSPPKRDGWMSERQTMSVT